MRAASLLFCLAVAMPSCGSRTESLSGGGEGRAGAMGNGGDLAFAPSGGSENGSRGGSRSGSGGRGASGASSGGRAGSGGAVVVPSCVPERCPPLVGGLASLNLGVCCTAQGTCGFDFGPLSTGSIVVAPSCQDVFAPARPDEACTTRYGTMDIHGCCFSDGSCGLDLSTVQAGCIRTTLTGRVGCEPWGGVVPPGR